MHVVGINAIVFMQAGVVWPGEIPPSDELARLFNALPKVSSLEDPEKIKMALDAITRWDNQPDHALQPSQNVRRQYWTGEFMAQNSDLKQAAAFFEDGLTLIEHHHPEDYDTRIEFHYQLATILNNNLQSRDALEHFRLAFELLHKRNPEPETRNPATYSQLANCIGRQYWNLADFELARSYFSRTITTVRGTPSGRQTMDLLREHANAFWMLGLMLRGQSDQADGDPSLLNTALKRMRNAYPLYERVGLPDYNLARFDIQISEVYFDLAETHQAIGADEAARAMLNRGRPLAERAVEFIKYADDPAGRLLAELARLRFDVMRTMTQSSKQRIAVRLNDIELQGADIPDRFVLAKAATLRGDWLIRLGEFEKAQMALQHAIDGFGENGKGMATRAERLMRQLPPAHDPEEGYGGADPERGGRN